MRKAELISALQEVDSSLRALQKSINELSGPQVKKQTEKDAARKIALKWFDNIEKLLSIYKIPDDITKKYHQSFVRLLKISHKNTRKAGYTKTINEIRATLTDDIIIPIYKYSPEINNFSQLDVILDTLTDEEKPLMQEAIDCASHNFLRASVILGWAAAINRIHRVIQNLGFDEFNRQAEAMNKSQTPRFKLAKKASSQVQYLSDLQKVFDNILLWVLEYWGLLEYNQHERLTQCFVMRNGCAHPSLTTVSPENVASFYSDLKTIVFDNPKFKLPATK